MKKNVMYFGVLLLSLLAMGVTLKSWAAPLPEPTNKLTPGQTFNMENDCVTFKVVKWNGDMKNPSGEQVGAYEVKIVGTDYDYVQDTPSELTINTVFQWKRGKDLVTFYVTGIEATNSTKKEAFWAQTNLTKVEIVNDETLLKNDQFQFTVGANAFNGCSNLAELSFPDNVKEIGEYAFRSTAITTFKIPAQCATIGQYAFDNTRKLATVTVSDGDNDKNGVKKGNTALTTISQKVFANSTVKVLDLSKARALTTIADDAFIYKESEVNNQLQKVILPDAIVVSNEVKTASIADGIYTNFNSLGTNGTAFRFCTGLKEIKNTELSKIATISNGAFEGDESLEELYLPKTAAITAGGSSVKSAFLGCESLKTLRFADGWNQTIGSDIYQSTGLTAAQQAAELSYLESIIFEGSTKHLGMQGTISASAFGNSDEKKACSALSTLTFKEAIVSGTIGQNAFRNCAALETVTFNGLASSSTGGTTIDTYAFAGTAIKTLDFKNVTNDVDKVVAINANAFACDDLGSVIFGNVTYASTSTSAEFKLADQAFVSDKLKSATFGAITAVATANKLTIGDGTNPVFDAKGTDDVLETVKFGALTAGTFAIAQNAFASDALKNVTIGNISSPDFEKAGTLTIGEGAFESDDIYKAQPKTVTIGAIHAAEADKKMTAANNLTVTLSADAFAGLLQSVTIGDINKKGIAGSTYNAAATKVEINAGAFANILQASDSQDAMDEDVTLGELGSTALDIKAGAFKGPQKAESTFDVTTGKLSQAITVAAKAFEGPAYGASTYTMGDVEVAQSNIAQGAFMGSLDNETDKNRNTDVTLGKYKASFSNLGTFQNVENLTLASWEVNASLNKFWYATHVTILGDVTGELAGGAMDQTKSLTIGGNVSAYIDDFGKGIRSIMFTSDDPEVKVAAFKAGSFQKAGADAYNKKEQIVVAYKTKTAAKSNAIFNAETFGTSSAAELSVVLYTDEWTKVNIFQNKSIYDPLPYRVQLSASDIVPGQDIEAICKTQTGGKYAYGRLYIPAGAGMYYKIDAQKVDNKNTVNLYWGYVDGNDIYMNAVLPQDGYYWIDATEADQILIVRTSDISAAESTVVAEAAEEDEIADPEIAWFDKDDAAFNKMKYATETVVNQELQNNTLFKNKSIYVMANPVKNGLAFAQLNQYKTSRDLSKNSLFILTNVTPDKAAARLNVIWPAEDGDDNATAIKSVEGAENEAGEIHNLAGQKVSGSFKGIVIKNGKKLLQK